MLISASINEQAGSIGSAQQTDGQIGQAVSGFSIFVLLLTY